MRLPASIRRRFFVGAVVGCLLLGLMQCTILTDSGHSEVAQPAEVVTESFTSAAQQTTVPIAPQIISAETSHEPAQEKHYADSIESVVEQPPLNGHVEALHAIDTHHETSNTKPDPILAEDTPRTLDNVPTTIASESTTHNIVNSPAGTETDLRPRDQHTTSGGDNADAASNAGAFVLLDVVSTNSGINGFPEIAVAQTLVSLLDSPAHLDSNPTTAESIADAAAATNQTTTTTPLPVVPIADITVVVQPHSAEDAVHEDALLEPVDDSSSTPAQVEPINDSGGGGGGDGSADPADSIEPAARETEHSELGSTSVLPVPAAPSAQPEESQIPLFSEWAQKRMEEAEKEQEQDAANSSTQKRNQTTGQKVGNSASLKLRTKNYASPDCGAKIVASNSESSNTRAVLTLTKDEYLLSPCTSRIWFVVELCEAIQAEQIDLANFELFSSSPHNFSVAVANRFPTRDWSQVGRFEALDERYIQSFDLHPHLFGKYVRVDIHSHYNSEHFCPISLFRVFGTSEFEAFETENRVTGDDDDDDDDDGNDVQAEGKEDRNIFKSASDAVMSIVKAAATFVKPQENRTGIESSTASDARESVRGNCISSAYAVRCENCSAELAQAVQELVSCKHTVLRGLLQVEGLRQAIVRSLRCSGILDNCAGESAPASQWITHLLPDRYVLALCHLMASDELMANRTGMRNSSRSNETASNVPIDLKPQKIKAHVRPEPVLDQRQPVIYVGPSDSGEKIDEDRSKEQPQPDQVLHPAIEEMTTNPTVEPTQIPSPVEIEDQTPVYLKGEDSKEEATPLDRELPESALHPTEVAHPDQQSDADKPLSELPVNSIIEMAREVLNATPEPISTTTSVPPTMDLDSAVLAVAEVTEAIAVSGNGGANGGAMSGGQKVQSESVFLRLSNRVKSLERNMSLSGQYLEELSRRYKKQVEELQLAVAKTLLLVEEQHKRRTEREELLLSQNERLRYDLHELSDRLGSWSQHFAYAATMLCLQFGWWALRRLCGSGSPRRNSADASEANSISSNLSTEMQQRSARLRRKSADGSTRRVANATASASASAVISASSASTAGPSAKRRRPSEEALHIGGTYADLMIPDESATTTTTDLDFDAEEYDQFVDPTSDMTLVGSSSLNARQQRRHRRQIKRTMSLDQSAAVAAAAMQQRGKRVGVGGSYDNLTGEGSDGESTAGSEPPLDENYEVYVPGTDMVYNEFMPDGPSGQSTPRIADTVAASAAAANGKATNAAASSASLVTSKKDKFRRLSSPAFLKSPFSRASSLSLGAGQTMTARKSPASPNEHATGWEWYRRTTKVAVVAAEAAKDERATSQPKEQKTKKSKKAKSESPPGSTNPSIPANGGDLRSSSASALSGSQRSALDGSTTSAKKHGSFRRMLKKVF